ncbi:mucin-5AC-like [Galendromus occidentalis]|uniref:Mucin-5AC-like n=1 Tax=Galendromus occidentalis TaxID=34638 RepID=A0AAJ7WHK0_9ACAR|nr:mucin-5AC-like [Galendromus occidentalis]
MRRVFLILSVSSFVLGQTTPDQTEGRPKYQRALTDLVPASLITVLDKYHRPINSNYDAPEPTKQKLTKAEILAKFTSARSSSTTPSTTPRSTTTTTRKPSSYVTSYPNLGQTDDGTETPFRILFIQTTTPSVPVDLTQPGFFTKVVTQTAKTVTVYEDGVARTETVTPSPSRDTTLSSSPDFSPVFIYKNQRFTSDSPNPVVSVASSVSTSDGEVFKNGGEIKAQTLQGLQNAVGTPAGKSSSTPRPRRKVIKVKSRKVLKKDREAQKTTVKPSTEAETTVETPKKKGASNGRAPKTNAPRERSKVLITRRLNNPQKSQSIEIQTTVAPSLEATSETPRKVRRPGGIRRSTAAPEIGKSTSEAPTTTATPARPLFRARVALAPSRAPSTAAPTLRSVIPTSSSAQFEPTKSPTRRNPQLSRTSPATSSSTLSNTRLPETSTTLVQTPEPSDVKSSTQPRISQKRVVTRIGTSRPVTTALLTTTPLPSAPTDAPSSTEVPPASRSPKKIVKRKKKPTASTAAPESESSDGTTVTPVSIIYFQTTRFTTPTPSVTEARRVGKKRRRKPSTAAGTVSTQPIPFSPTEPSTFSAPQAVTGFRPITTSNYFPTPEHLQHLPKTDEIAQVINLPGGRLSSYQARYSPQRQQEFVPDRAYDTSIPNPSPQQIPRIPPNQRAIRPGPFTVDEFFANDPTYQDLQRLLVAETNRFHSQPRNSARYSPYQDRAVDYRSSK